MQNEIGYYAAQAKILVAGYRLCDVVRLVGNIEGRSHNRILAQRHNGVEIRGTAPDRANWTALDENTYATWWLPRTAFAISAILA